MWANRKTSTNLDDAKGMHLLIVRYTLEKMTLDEHFELGVNVSPNFTPEKIEGFIGKSFIGNADTGIFGGVYHFKTKEAINNYLSSEFWQGIENHPNLVNFTKEIYFLLTLPAISIGLLSTAVLNLNNMRDYQNDKKSNKNTIVVKIGLKAAKRYHYSLLLLSFISAVSYVVLTFTKTVQFIFLLAYIPLVIHALFVYNNKEELRLDAELKKVALSTFLFSVFLGLGQVL